MTRMNPHVITEPVTVETRTGHGSKGAVYASPVATRCQLENKLELVRDRDGAEVVSSTTARFDPSTDPALDLLALLLPESRVTVAGRTARLIAVKSQRWCGQLVYVEASLT